MADLAASAVSLARTGLGAASQHNSSFSYNGSQYYDPVLIAGVSLETSILMAAAPAGASSVTAGLLTASLFAAGTSSTSAVTANLTTDIRIAATPASLSGASAALTTDIRLAASPAALSAVTAPLTTDIRLAAAPAALSDVSSSLTTAIHLAATPAAQSAAGADLTTSILLGASPAALSDSAASLTTNIRLAAAPVAVADAGGTLTAQILFDVAAVSDSSAIGALTTSIQLAAATAGESAGAGALQTDITMAAELLSESTVTATFEIAGITWSDDAGIILSLIKGQPVSKTITAEILPVNGAQSYAVLANSLPASVIVTVSASGVALSGDSSLFMPPDDIYYRQGNTLGQTPNPAAVPVPSKPYQWLASDAIDETRSITIMVSNAGDSEIRTFDVFVANNWDAHKAALLSLLAATA
jgi:hypothetical protein